MKSFLAALAVLAGAFMLSSQANAQCNVPTNMATTSIDDTSAVLTWDTALTAIGYRIRYKVAGDTLWNLVFKNQQQGVKTIIGLDAGTTYKWQIKSNCDTGLFSAWTLPYQAFTTTAPTCDTVTGPQTLAVTETSAVLSWGTVSGATGYMARYRVAGSAIWDSITIPTNIGTQQLTGLPNGTVYKWQVRTICAIGASAWSSPQQSFTTVTPPCDTVSNPQATGITQNGVNLSWNTVTNATGYYVRYRIAGTVNWDTITVAGNIGTQVLGGLLNSTIYKWQIQTICTAGAGDWTLPYQSFTTAGPPCTVPAPGNLSTTNVQDVKARTNWSTAAGAFSYVIRWREMPAGVWSTKVRESTTQNWIEGLNPSTSYVWQIKSNCSTDTTNSGAWSAAQPFTTTEPVGIFERPQYSAVSVFPNPSNGQFTVALGNESAAAKVQVYNLVGELVQTELVPAGTNRTIDVTLADATPGLYIVRIAGDGFSKVARLTVE